jgi:glycerol-3-phosphate dehydrogenase (NAD(P)+)
LDKQVGIIGGGSWGTALASVVAKNGHGVLQWMRDNASIEEMNANRSNTRYLPGLSLPTGIEATGDLVRLAQDCKLILIAVPSQHMRAVVGELASHLDGSHLLVHGAKGLEMGTLKRMSVLLKEETCCKKIGVLSGPNLAREIAEGQPSAAVIASHYDEVIQAARDVLVGPTFRLYGSPDVVGAEVGGALKNILAIASGLAQGLGFGDNTKALLLTRGLAEMARFGVHFGANAGTFSGLSGIGDLMATCFSPLSRNYQVGLRLAVGESVEEITTAMRQVAEGIKAAKAVHDLANSEGIYMPITEGVYHILYGNVAPLAVLTQLMDITRYVYEEAPEIKGDL